MDALPAAGCTATVFLFILVGLRTIGRRQSAQLTAMDLLIVLLLGSAVETSMIGIKRGSEGPMHDPNTSLVAGLVAAGTLFIIDFLFARASERWPGVARLLGGKAMLLCRDGAPIQENLRRAGMTDDDLLHALRTLGYDSPTEVRFAVLEPNGDVDAVPVS